MLHILVVTYLNTARQVPVCVPPVQVPGRDPGQVPCGPTESYAALWACITSCVWEEDAATQRAR